MTEYRVFARKFRPQFFHEVLGQDHIVQTLKNALKRNKTAHAYIFCGMRGTGKTTLARILAKALNCAKINDSFEPCNSCSSCREITNSTSLDVIEIDGASNRGIDDIRRICETISYAPAHGTFKIYIIDEVHMLTKEAFNALLKTLEEPPQHVKFFFATTELNRIPDTIISRCQTFQLRRLPQDLIMQKLKKIADSCLISIEESALSKMSTYAVGGLRDAESLFEQVSSFTNGAITDKEIENTLGILPDIYFEKLDTAKKERDIKCAFEISHALFSTGKDLGYFLLNLAFYFRQKLITLLEQPAVQTFYTQDQIIQILQKIHDCERSLKNVISEQVAIEILLIDIIRIELSPDISSLVIRLENLEEKLRTHNVQQSGSDLLHTKSQNSALKNSITNQNIPNPNTSNSSISNSSISNPGVSNQKPFEELKDSAPLKKMPIQSNPISAPSVPQSLDSLSPIASDPSQTKVAQKTEQFNKVELPKSTPLQNIQSQNTQLQNNSLQNVQLQTALIEIDKSIQEKTSNQESIERPTSTVNISDERKKKAHYDTLMQFASVELDSTIQKKNDLRKK